MYISLLLPENSHTNNMFITANCDTRQFAAERSSNKSATLLISVN